MTQKFADGMGHVGDSNIKSFKREERRLQGSET